MLTFRIKIKLNKIKKCSEHSLYPCLNIISINLFRPVFTIVSIKLLRKNIVKCHFPPFPSVDVRLKYFISCCQNRHLMKTFDKRINRPVVIGTQSSKMDRIMFICIINNHFDMDLRYPCLSTQSDIKRV